MTAAVGFENVQFAYPRGGFALTIDSLEIASGERVACIGPSGTGKTTLVNLIAGIERPDRGVVRLHDLQVQQLSDRDRRSLRNRRIGMVFQEFELLDYLSSLDNILLPYHVAGSSDMRLTTDVRQRARDLAEAMRIAHVVERSPRLLSQGERQRVAICRALVTRPELILCDEPTGNLDPDTADVTLDLLFEQVREVNATMLMVTHNHAILSRFDRVIDIRDLNR